MTRRELRLEGRVLRWLEAGQGAPAVVFEAGYGDTSEAWTRVVPRLAATTRVIAYDRAGLGASDLDTVLPTLDRRLTDLSALIESAGAAPCVVAGHSWGGILALGLACRRPDLVAGLVLVDPADPDMLAPLPRWLRGLVGSATEALARLRSAGVRQERRGIIASASAILDLHAGCPPPDVPVVVLSAGRGFPAAVRRHWTSLQTRLAESAPQGRHVLVPDSGHAIPTARPDVVAESIRGLVDGLRKT
jgi:pimeloyl-ACP methyl ester carboxylesterase